jgi:hypothetical protein
VNTPLLFTGVLLTTILITTILIITELPTIIVFLVTTTLTLGIIIGPTDMVMTTIIHLLIKIIIRRRIIIGIIIQILAEVTIVVVLRIITVEDLQGTVVGVVVTPKILQASLTVFQIQGDVKHKKRETPSGCLSFFYPSPFSLY